MKDTCDVFLCYRGGIELPKNMYDYAKEDSTCKLSLHYSPRKISGDFMKPDDYIKSAAIFVIFLSENFSQGFLDANGEKNKESAAAEELCIAERERQRRGLKFLLINIDGYSKYLPEKCKNGNYKENRKFKKDLENIKQLYEKEGILKDDSLKVFYNSRSKNYSRSETKTNDFIKDYLIHLAEEKIKIDNRSSRNNMSQNEEFNVPSSSNLDKKVQKINKDKTYDDMNNIGVGYYQKNSQDGYEKAYSIFSCLALLGHMRAQCNLGVCYQFGKGVAQDLKKAVKWYTKSAEQGYTGAQNNLGVCYQSCNEIGIDLKKAVEWYRKAADKGYAKAQCNLGICYQFGNGVNEDLKVAMEWYRKAANQGNVKAQFYLGNCYYNGDGVEKDLKEATKWFIKAVNQGFAAAQCNLGYCYENGEGVEKDLNKAFELYTKSAEQGDEVAQSNLAECYEEGKGVAQDYKKAYEWYKKSYDNGYEEAKKHIDRVEKLLKENK